MKKSIKKALLLICLCISLGIQATRSALRESKEEKNEQKNKVQNNDEKKEKKVVQEKNKNNKKRVNNNKKQKSYEQSKKTKSVKKTVEKNESDKKDNVKRSISHRTEEKNKIKKQEREGIPTRKELADQRKADRKADRIALGQDKDSSYVAQEEYARKLYTDVDYGFLKTSLFKAKFLNSSNLEQVVTQAHSAALPMIRMGFGVDFVGLGTLCRKRTTHGRVGLEVAFAKRDDAVDTIYTSTSSTLASASIIGKQSIFRGELMLIGSYDLWRDTLSVEGGIGVVGGALKEFRLYQSNGEQKPFYTGQYLKPHSTNLGGFIGVAIAHRFKDMERLRFEFGYRAVFSAVKYYQTVYQDAPVPYNQVATIWQNAYIGSLQNGLLFLPAEPHFRICAHQLALSVVVDL